MEHSADPIRLLSVPELASLMLSWATLQCSHSSDYRVDVVLVLICSRINLIHRPDSSCTTPSFTFNLPAKMFMTPLDIISLNQWALISCSLLAGSMGPNSLLVKMVIAPQIHISLQPIPRFQISLGVWQINAAGSMYRNVYPWIAKRFKQLFNLAHTPPIDLCRK